MSGNTSLAAAKRRRAGPTVTNDPPRRPSNIQSSNQNYNQNYNQSSNQPTNIQQGAPINPLMVLVQHDQIITSLQREIEDLKINDSTPQSVDSGSIEYFKSQYETLLADVQEMKKVLIKVQTFSMETNLELLKMKRLLKNDPRLKEIEEEKPSDFNE